MSKPQHTPLPWAVWKLAPDSDEKRRHIIVTADGEQEITGIVHREADAHHIVRCVNAHDSLLEALERAEFLMRRVAEGDHQALGNLPDAANQALAAIAEATGRAA